MSMKITPPQADGECDNHLVLGVFIDHESKPVCAEDERIVWDAAQH
jgi:hypothetical protein